MIKPLNTTQLSSAKPRTGLQSIADLLPRLIQQYELQAELVRRHSQSHGQAETVRVTESGKQITFNWYK